MSVLEIIILLPILGALAIWLGASSRMSACMVATINLVLVLWLFGQFHYEHITLGTYHMAFVSSHEVLKSPSIHFAVGADGLSLTMALLTALVTWAAVWSTVGKDRLYYISALLISGGALGAFLTTDLFFIYAFHELALIPTLLMIALWGHGDCKRAAWKITIYLGAASLVLLAGLLGVVFLCRPENSDYTFDLLKLKPVLAGAAHSAWVPANFFTLLLGFGALVSLFPMHSWAAPAYASAPTPVAMLHSGVLKKFGLYGLIRIALPLMPGAMQTPWIQQALLLMLLGNILVIGLVTIYQRNLDDILANSSVMHMGYIFLGLASGTLLGINGAVLLMFAHGISIALLFLLSGKLRSQLGTLEISRLGGLAANAPILCLMFGIAGFASIGLPGLANFTGEILVFFGAFNTLNPIQGLTLLHWTTILSLWGVVISAVYMLRAYRGIFFGNASTGMFIIDPSPSQRLPLYLLAVVLFVVGCHPGLLLDVLQAPLTAVLGQ